MITPPPPSTHRRERSPTLLPPEQAADIDTLLDILIAIAQRILRDEGQCVLELPPSDRQAT